MTWKLKIIILLISVIVTSCATVNNAINATQEDEVQLSTPKAGYESRLFADKLEVKLELDQPDCNIHYTLDGSIPDINAAQYNKAIQLTESTILSAIAVHPNMITSEAIQLEFVKANPVTSLASASLSRQPSEKYSGGGAASLFDLSKGSDNFGDGQWMGYEGGSVTIDVKLDKKETINSIKVSTLYNAGAWIMLPHEVIVYIDGTLYVTTQMEPEATALSSQTYLTIPLPSVTADQLKIELVAIASLPDWHQGKGNPAWMFIDEILIN